MRDKNKTERFFDLFTWLSQSGESGISYDSIVEEYKISDKTFHRDIEELGTIFPFLNLRYDKEERRLFGHLQFAGGGAGKLATATSGVASGATLPDEKGNPLRNKIENKIDILQKVENKNANEAVLLHIEDSTKLSMSDAEFSILLDCILSKKIAVFTHKNRIRQCIPLFMCYYTDRWYLFCYNLSGAKIVKYRLDLIEKISHEILRDSSKLPSESDLEELHLQSVEKIKKSHNIFIDLNSDETVEISLRFFFPLSYIKQEIQGATSLTAVDAEITDLSIEFSCYSEAKMFLTKWLGVFQILEPESFRQRFIDDLEEALGIL